MGLFLTYFRAAPSGSLFRSGTLPPSRSKRYAAGKKKPLKVCEAFRGKKISGAVLLSHSQICSTIAAGVLNYRVREGNVCDSPAMDAEKYYNEEKHVFRINHVEAQQFVE